MTGNVARRPSGRWRARYRDESGREHARHFEDRPDARRWLDQVARAGHPAHGQVTFEAFFEEWSSRQLWSPATLSAMSLAARTVPFRGTALTEIGRRDVETWVKSMDVSGLAPGTVKTRYVNVRSVFRAALEEHLVDGDPTDRIRLPRRRRSTVAMSIPSPHEVGALVTAASDDFRAFVALCAFAGLRLGEAAGVQSPDIDFDRSELRVARQVQNRGGGRIDVLPPKYRSERSISLAPGLRDLLRTHIENSNHDGDVQWLFQRNGGPLHQQSAAYLGRKTLGSAGLSGIRLHDLRHFYASGLIAEGCDVVTVQRSLGHANATTTLNTYAHLWPRAADRTRAAAQSIIVASLGVGSPSRSGSADER